MKTSRSILLGLALLAASGAARAEDRGFYVGVDIGQANVSSDQRALDASLVYAFNQLGLDIVNGSSDVGEDSLTYGLLVGYQILPYLAVEASYIDAGEFQYRARGTVTDGVTSGDGHFALDAAAKGPTVSVLGILPFANDWRVFGRVGMLFARTSYDYKVTIDDSVGTSGLSRSSENFLWGVGVGYTSGVWTSRIEYQQIQDMGDKDITGQVDSSRVTYSAIYRF